MLSLNDVVPVFYLFFFGVLPSLLLLLFVALIYKLMKKGQERLAKFQKKLKQGNEAEKEVGPGEGESFYMQAFHEVIDFIFSDALITIVVVLPMMLMVLNFIFSTPGYMLEHFWDYTYPALATIVAVTALKIWSNMLYKFARTFGLKKPKRRVGL